MENLEKSTTVINNTVRVTEWVDPKKLIPHPANSKLYSDINDVSDLVISIRAGDGIIHPIIVNPDLEILSGHRRARAAIKEGLELVPIQIVSEVEDEKVFIINANISRKKTYRTIVAEALMLKEHALKLKQQKQIYELRKLYPEAITKKDGWNTNKFVSRVMNMGLSNLKKLLRIHEVDDSLLDLMDGDGWSIDKTYKLAKRVYTGEDTELPTHRKAKYFCKACGHKYTINVAIEEYKEDSAEEILNTKVKRTDTDPEKNPVNMDEYFNTEANKKTADVINSLYDNAAELIVPVVTPVDEDTDPFKDLGNVNDGQIKIPFLLPPFNRPIINVNEPAADVAKEVVTITEEVVTVVTNENNLATDVTTTSNEVMVEDVVSSETNDNHLATDTTISATVEEIPFTIIESEAAPDATATSDEPTPIINDNNQATNDATIIAPDPTIIKPEPTADANERIFITNNNSQSAKATTNTTTNTTTTTTAETNPEQITNPLN